MPDTGSYPKQTRDWEGILAAAEEHAAVLPDVQTEKQELQQQLDKVKSIKDRQQSHTAARQVATQDLKEALKEGRDLAMKLRDAAKFKIGRRNEGLVQFNVTPLRKRTRKAQPAAASTTKPPV